MDEICVLYCDLCDDICDATNISTSPFRWAGREDVIDNCYKIFRAYSYGIDTKAISEWAYGSKSTMFVSIINDIIAGKRYGNYTLDAVLVNNDYNTVSYEESKQISEFLQPSISDPDLIIKETAEFIVGHEDDRVNREIRGVS